MSPKGPAQARALTGLMCALALFAGACRGGGPAPPARLGDSWVLLTREAEPRGVVERRETWTLADTASGRGRFRIERDGRDPREHWQSLEGGPPGGRSRRRVIGDRIERLKVPAGTYACRRTVSTFEEPNGRVMRMDEWWAEGVPLPVQRWTRWEGLPDAQLYSAPRRASELILGAEWSVLERAPRR